MPNWITCLTLVDFRNYTRLQLSIEERPIVLTGSNGAGKTSLLEAVSFLTPGRGLRQARLSDITRRGAIPNRGWMVTAKGATPSGPIEVSTSLEPSTERRTVRIGGISKRGQGALADIFTIVWLTPAMDRLFVETPSVRRRFLDRLVFAFDPSHAGRVWTYEHAMRERSRVLREGRSDSAWLTTLETAMAERGVAVTIARREIIRQLAWTCTEPAGPFPQPVLALTGTVEKWLDVMSVNETEQRLRLALLAKRGLDAQIGGATEGPHRSDLVVRHAARNLPAAQCSTGEQKALLIALILAQARMQTKMRGFAPLLLLDEIVAHLDLAHRQALFDAVCTVKAQAWLTGTDQTLFSGFGERAQFLHIENGEVMPRPSI